MSEVVALKMGTVKEICTDCIRQTKIQVIDELNRIRHKENQMNSPLFNTCKKNHPTRTENKQFFFQMWCFRSRKAKANKNKKIAQDI